MEKFSVLDAIVKIPFSQYIITYDSLIPQLKVSKKGYRDNDVLS